MARDIDPLIDAAGRRMLGDAPPMPGPLERAVRSRRQSILIWRASAAAACIAATIGTLIAITASRHTTPPPADQPAPMASALTPQPQSDAASRPPTLGSLRAATRLGAEGVERATQMPIPDLPVEVTSPFAERVSPRQ